MDIPDEFRTPSPKTYCSKHGDTLLNRCDSHRTDETCYKCHLLEEHKPE